MGDGIADTASWGLAFGTDSAESVLRDKWSGGHGFDCWADEPRENRLHPAGRYEYGQSVLRRVAERVASGETVTFRLTGNSMTPLIQSRDEVVALPVEPNLVEIGDIVLTRVKGTVYVHLVKAVDKQRRRALIGNNRGGTNGWTGFDRVYGIVVSVAAGSATQGARRSR